MRAGRLRRRVTLQRPVSSRDSYGDDVPTWADAFSRWAGIEPTDGSESWLTHQETATQGIRVVLRYDSNTATISPDWRIDWGGKKFDIQFINNVGQLNSHLLLTCEYRQLPEIGQ